MRLHDVPSRPWPVAPKQQGVLNGVVTDAKGLKDGKMPTQMTIIAMTGAALLLMLIAAIRTPTKPRPKKD